MPIEIRDLLVSGASLAFGGANVIMQLSRSPVGHGVIESRVESGSLHRHPLKRTRTTLGYIMISLFGTDHEREVLRREVNRQHRQVRSLPDDPVAYNAFDPELQLWIAACMFRGVQDAVTLFHGPQSPEVLEQVYRHCSRFATTLQVPASMWPSDLAAFESYWREALARVSMDQVTRDFLYGLASLDFLAAPLRVTLGPLHRLVTTGFLPETVRDELGLAWTARRQRAFDVAMSGAARVNRGLPRLVREFPWNVYLWDAQRRIRSGRPFV